MSSFYQYVLGVMCKTPERREPDEVSLIASWLFGLFKKKSSFFGDLDLGQYFYALFSILY